jgi:hypothetical protein
MLTGMEMAGCLFPRQTTERGNRIWVVLPAAFGIGILMLTWAVYILSWMFSICAGVEHPLFYGNLIVFLDYILVGEIYLPLIAVPEEKREIGFYGSLHRNYLKDYKSGLYSYLTLSGKLWTYLADLNEQCLERRDFLMEQIMEQEGITEELKSRDQMEWVRRANNARSRVDEIINEISICLYR